MITYRKGNFDYDVRKASLDAGLDCTGDPGKAQQNFKDECDINTIVKRFGLTGQLPQNVRTPLEGDFIEVTDYHTALNAIRAADEAFMQMPADVRARFDNDAGRFVDFASDPANLEECRKLGLAPPVPEAPPPAPAPEPAPAG